MWWKKKRLSEETARKRRVQVRAFIAAGTEVERHPLNTPGPFFVERGHCIACRSPELAAPDLMRYGGSGVDEGCYFQRQPSTPGEVEQAVNAVQVSCGEAVRYAGENEAIIQALGG